MRGFADEPVERPTEPGAAFVAMRFVGGFSALAGGSSLGLLLAGEPCLPTAREAAFWAWGAGSFALAGLFVAIGAWWPARSLRRAAAILVLGAITSPVVAHLAQVRERARIKRTMSDMRGLAFALDGFRRDNGRWPAESAEFSDVASALDPSRTRKEPLPRTDAWGGAFSYQRDGERYALLAPCRCGRFDAPRWSDYDQGHVEDPRSDYMLLSDRFFVRFPRGGSAPSEPAEFPPPR